MRIVAVLVRRLGAALFTLWAMITLTFALFWAIPSEPEVYVYPYAQHLSEYQIKHADHLLGLDRPKLEQYGDYLWHIVRFDFGGQWTGATVTAGQKIVEAPIRPVLVRGAGRDDVDRPRRRDARAPARDAARCDRRPVRGHVAGPDDLARRPDRDLHPSDGASG